MHITHHMRESFDRLLLPLAKLLVSKGIPFPEFSDRMKRNFVHAAEAAGDSVTVSQISIATGLQRRDVSRLRGSDVELKSAPNPLSKVVAAWQTDPAFSQDGVPRPLHRSGSNSFDTLARSVLKDVHPKTLLDALVQAGTVSLHGDLCLLVAEAYVPTAGSDEQDEYLARNVGDHLSAAHANTQIPSAGLFERAVHYDGLTKDQVEKLHTLFQRAQMKTLKDLNAQAAAFQTENGDTGTYRFRAGGYFFKEEQDNDHD